MISPITKIALRRIKKERQKKSSSVRCGILFDADDHLLCVLPLANSKAQCRRLLRTSYQRMHEYCYCGADGYYVYYRQNLLQYAK
ncbi:MAG: hypothetical protein IJD79_00895 [Clostridia bacterium]|nr:hypothetical protein [Clostridia bacterium]